MMPYNLGSIRAIRLMMRSIPDTSPALAGEMQNFEPVGKDDRVLGPIPDEVRRIFCACVEFSKLSAAYELRKQRLGLPEAKRLVYTAKERRFTLLAKVAKELAWAEATRVFGHETLLAYTEDLVIRKGWVLVITPPEVVDPNTPNFDAFSSLMETISKGESLPNGEGFIHPIEGGYAIAIPANSLTKAMGKRQKEEEKERLANQKPN